MRFQGLDLNLLLALDRLIKDESVTVAARHLNMSPSAVSHALNRLREHFGDELLTAAGRQLVLTPLAQTLAEPLREALEKVEAVVSHSPRFEPGSARRHVSIMASDYAILVALAPAIRRIRSTAPGFTFEIATPSDPVVRLSRGDVDLIVLPLQHLASDQPNSPLFDDEYVIAVWSEGRLARRTIDLDCYFSAGHVAARFALGESAGYAEALGIGAPRARRVDLTAPAFTSVPLFVPGSDLIATIPKRLALEAAKTLPLTLKALPFESPAIHEHVQWSGNRDADSSTRWLVRALADTSR